MPSTSTSTRVGGFTLVEVMIVVAIVGLLATMAIPHYLRAAEASRANACINNLRQIDQAKEQWAFENNKASGEAVTDADLDIYVKRGYDGIIEPLGGDYNIMPVGEDPQCNVFENTVHPATI
jgi:prepilin-type N-terminal cleavage/methylation domain-containing protein